MPQPKRTFGNYNPHKPLKLPKGKIQKIDWKEHEQEVKRIWKGLPPSELVKKWEQKGVSISQAWRYYNAGSMLARMNRIRRLFAYDGSNLVGLCSECKRLNEYILKQKSEGCTIITRYCSEHVPDKI